MKWKDEERGFPKSFISVACSGAHSKCLFFGFFLSPLLLRLNLPLGKHIWRGTLVRRKAALYMAKTFVAKCSVDTVHPPRGLIT